VGRLETPKHGGGKLMRGNPDQRSGGRYSKRFKRWCQLQLVHSDVKRAVRKARRKAARTGDMNSFLPTMGLLAKYGMHELTKDKDVNLNAGKDLLSAVNEALKDE
jgi:hypothetical protein